MIRSLIRDFLFPLHVLCASVFQKERKHRDTEDMEGEGGLEVHAQPLTDRIVRPTFLLFSAQTVATPGLASAGRARETG